MKTEELTLRRGDAYAARTGNGLEEAGACLTAGEQSEPAETTDDRTRKATDGNALWPIVSTAQLHASSFILRASLTKVLRSLVFCLALGLCWACADDLDAPGPSGEGDSSVITLSVPYTRTIPTTDEDGDHLQADADELERKVTSLWFLAFPTDGQGEAVVQTLDPTPEDLEHDTPRTFSIRMKHGTYRVYVVANVSGITTQTTEDALRLIMLKAQTDDQGRFTAIDPTAQGFSGLPMLYEGSFTVAQAGQKLEADLVFCCVKVKYTLQFDNTEGTGDAHAVFGKNTLRVDHVSALQVAPEVPLVPRTPHHVPDAGVLLHSADDAFDGAYLDAGGQPDATADEPANPGQWTYTGTLYLPEHYITAETQSQQTQLRIAASIYDPAGVKKSNVEYVIDLGDTATDQNEDPDDLRQLPRGHYYDITARIAGLGRELQATAVVNPWTLQSLTTSAEGPYWLWVEKTSIPLASGQVQTILLRTDAPRLDFGQNPYTLTDGTSIDPYILTLADGGESGTDTLRVSLNPRMPVGQTDVDKYFWIDVQDKDEATCQPPVLRKYIQIDPLQNEPYLIVSPPQYTIYIKQISNEPTYAVQFTYETNLDNVEVTDDCTNNNISIDNSGLGDDGRGTITVTLNEPYLPANFPRNEKILFSYTATGGSYTLGAETQVTIVPNAIKYTLHFRPKYDSWNNPHIYVYEVLYATDGKEVRLTGALADEHAVSYGFTGMRTYRGWLTEGGEIGDPVVGGNGDIENRGTYWEAKTSAYDPGSNDAHFVYNESIDYCPDFRSGTPCTECNKEGVVNPKWPGVAMKPDPDNPGWYYFDLPALASPGTTLIMFANTHDSGDGGDDGISAQYRYPAHMEPGVPLYDYEDKDGWFLYDHTKGTENEFVDDKPDIADAPALPKGTYRIWCTNTSYTSIHVWWGSSAAYATWGSSDELLLTDPGTGRKYFDLEVGSRWRPIGNDLTVKYILHNNGSGQAGDQYIYQNEWTQVTGKDYDYEVYK